MTIPVSRVDELVLKRISAGDDPAFWSEAVSTLLCDVEARDLDGRGRDEVVLQVGAWCCVASRMIFGRSCYSSGVSVRRTL